LAQTSKNHLKVGYGLYYPPGINIVYPDAERVFRRGTSLSASIGRRLQTGYVMYFTVEKVQNNYEYKDRLKLFTGKQNFILEDNFILSFEKPLIKYKKVHFTTGFGVLYKIWRLSEVEYIPIPDTNLLDVDILNESYNELGGIGTLSLEIGKKDFLIGIEGQGFWLIGYEKLGYTLKPTLKVRF